MQSRTGNKEESGKNMNFIEFKDRKSFTCNRLACTISQLASSLLSLKKHKKPKKDLNPPNQPTKTKPKKKKHNLNLSQQWRWGMEMCAILFARFLVPTAQKHTELDRAANHPPKLQ